MITGHESATDVSTRRNIHNLRWLSIGHSSGAYWSSTLRLAYALLAVIVCCGCIARADQHVVLVAASGSFDEQRRRTASYVTADQLDRIKDEIKSTLPGVTDDDLRRMSLKWEEHTSLGADLRPVGDKWLTITVRVETSPLRDPSQIVKLAAEIVERDVNTGTALTGLSVEEAR